MDTRQQILEKNYHALHRHGYQGMRADKVTEELGITKGALYHYFPTKLELGYAVVDEILAPIYVGQWAPLKVSEGNPIDGIIAVLQKHVKLPKDITLGCPLNNLMQEMSPLDAGFRTRLQNILLAMADALESALLRGQKSGVVKKNIDAKQTAFFILSSIEGAYGLAKTMQSKKVFESAVHALSGYVESLRAE